MSLSAAVRFQQILASVLAVWLAACGGCRKAVSPASAANDPAAAPWLRDVSDSVGLRFTHSTGKTDRFFMPETVGSGAALFDYDNDGRLDIYLIQNGGPDGPKNQLFHQEADGTFRDVSAGSGLDIAGWGMGVAIGDVNNDGLPDVLVTEFGRVRLFLNEGNGKFRDVTNEAGIDDPHWAVSAAFIDYDRDGWLDIVVGNYIAYDNRACTDEAGRPDYCGPGAFPGVAPTVYRNLGGLRVEGWGFSKSATGKISSAPNPDQTPNTPSVRFKDVSVSTGVGAPATAPGMAALGVTCLDFDGDGWPDIFVTNDGKPNSLWLNQHDGTFKQSATLRGLAYNAMGQAQANMGIAISDVTGDGLFDIYVTHLTEENNVLWRQGPRGFFQDRTGASGLASASWHATGFGAAFADFDNDGWPDLAVVNGRVRRSTKASSTDAGAGGSADHWLPYLERNQLFANEGSGRFRDISTSNGGDFCAQPAVGRGLAMGDLFNDGGIALLTTYADGRARLYRDAVSTRGHWLVVHAIDPSLGGRDAYGAQVAVSAGGRRRVGWVNPGSSYACSNDPSVHFGLGSETKVDSIEVLWPDGRDEAFPSRDADRILILKRGEGAVRSVVPATAPVR